MQFGCSWQYRLSWRSLLLACVILAGVNALWLLTRLLDRQDSPFCDLERPYRPHVKKRGGLTCPITFVTQYYQIPSKHPHAHYVDWIKNIRGVCLLVFTDSPELWNVSDQVVFHTPSICEEGRALNRSQCFWREQWMYDPEASIHRSYQLYLAWNLKPHFLSEAVRLDPFGSDYFFWMDAGYMRTPSRSGDDARSLVPSSIKSTRMHFLLVNRFSQAELSGQYHYYTHQDRIAGNMFGGHRTTVQPWVDLYYQVFRQYVDAGWFVGKDQNIMNTVCARHPSACYLVDPMVSVFANPWFSMWECLLGQRGCLVLTLNESIAYRSFSW